MTYSRKDYWRSKLWYQRLSVERQLLRNAQGRARQQKVLFTITLEDIVVPEFCPVLGHRLQKQRYKSNAENRGASAQSPSLDRIRPRLGYVPGNVKVISARANRLKCDCTDPAELRAVADYIERNRA